MDSHVTMSVPRKHLQLIRRAAVALAWSLTALPATAETIPIDDFTDGHADGWSTIDSTVGKPWGPSHFGVNGKGEYRLAANGPIPVWASEDFLASAWEPSSNDPFYSQGWLRARIRVGNHFNNPGLAMRSTGSLETGFSSYLFRLIPDLRSRDHTLPSGTICIVRVGGPEDGGEACEPFPHDIDEDLWVMAGAVGDELTMKVWRVGELEPEEPQVTMIDGHHAQGEFGVLSSRHSAAGGTTFVSPLSSTFDDITFTPVDGAVPLPNSPSSVPEPSGFMGMLLGWLVLGRLRQRRTERYVATASCTWSLCRSRLCLPLLLLSVGGFTTGTSHAQVELDLGMLRPAAEPLNTTILIPEGTFNRVRLSTDWSASGTWSREAIWTLLDGDLGEPGTRYYANPGSAPNSAADSHSITLIWDEFLDFPLRGPAEVSLLSVHTHNGSNHRWANTRLELSLQDPPPTPTLTAELGLIATEIEAVRMLTDGNFDTELGIYSTLTGSKIASNDDSLSDELRGTVRSELDFRFGLPQGDYIAVLGSFNTSFEDAYAVAPGLGGGEYELEIADVTYRGVLANGEVAYLGFTIGGPDDVVGDCSEDGVVDHQDTLCASALSLPTVLARGNLIQGDANGDGQVGFDDFLTLSDYFGRGGNYAQGNFDLLGGVDFADFLILADNFGQIAAVGGSANVPEPNEVWPAMFVVVAVLTRRGRR